MKLWDEILLPAPDLTILSLFWVYEIKMINISVSPLSTFFHFSPDFYWQSFFRWFRDTKLENNWSWLFLSHFSLFLCFLLSFSFLSCFWCLSLFSLSFSFTHYIFHYCYSNNELRNKWLFFVLCLFFFVFCFLFCFVWGGGRLQYWRIHNSLYIIGVGQNRS